ncbi:hypothetical protein ACTU6V_05400 [Microbacterium sp. A204]|uniref:hypothetical protein n=1 Tax=Microbacterium sp. A204 TaxID=3457321 RepID=UPI003FD403DB
MAGGYTVGIASETKAFKQGIESGVIDPLEDAQKELVELGKSKGPDQLERSLKDAGKATDRLKDETKDAARAIEQEYRDSYRKAKQSADDGLDGMKRHTEETTGELKQNIGETFSSFRGDLEDLPQIAQDVFGGLAGSVGTLGASLGLGAAAAGVGLIIQAFNQSEEAAQQAAEASSAWADKFVESGQRAATASQQAAEVIAISTDPERYKEASEAARLWGVENEIAINALAGNPAAMKAVEDALDRKREATEKDTQAAQEAAEAAGGSLVSLTHLEVELNNAEAAWKKHTDAMAGGVQQADDASASLLNLIAQEEGLARAVDDLGNSVITLPDGTEIFIDAKTGQATLDVTRFKDDTDGVIDHLNGRDVLLKAKADVWAAQNEINRFISQNDGKSFKLHGRVTVDSGWQ